MHPLYLFESSRYLRDMINTKSGFLHKLQAHLFVHFPLRKQIRFMTSHKRVQDRSVNKRVHDLEMVTEKWKIMSKVLAVIEVLKQEPEMVMRIKDLNKHSKKINLPEPYRVYEFLKKSPRVFELFKDERGVLWCGITNEAEGLVKEEETLLEDHSGKAAEYVARCLMMSVDKRLPLDKIAHFRRDFGLPVDFRSRWVHNFPGLFKVEKSLDQVNYLELLDWNPSWAITELEKKVLGVTEICDHKPGMLSLAFPLKFPFNYKKVYVYREKIEQFQKRSYLSPYADASGLTAGSLEFDKRAVAVMHELLSFTIEKRLVTDYLTHFRREFVMPQKLMRLLLKNFGIFYVSERGKRFSAFLTEAYDGQELIEKSPLVHWKEKLLSIVDYRGRKSKRAKFSDVSDMEDGRMIEDGYENGYMSIQLDHKEEMDSLDTGPLFDNGEMEVGEIGGMYEQKEVL